MEEFPGDVTALVLCGGAAVRMGGIDKPLAEWRGKPLIDHVLARMPMEIPRLISANRNLDAYGARGEVFTDLEVLEAMDVAASAQRGPLVGVFGGLSRSHTDWLLVCPGDTPMLPEDWCRRMWEAARAAGGSVVAHDGARQQHLHLLLHASALESLSEFLLRGHHEVYRWLQQINVRQAKFDDPEAFRNFNSPRDFD